MQPLNSFRDWLKEIRDDQTMRNQIRRDGSKGAGTFNESTRKKILKRLFKTEKKIKRRLISNDEIQYVQQQWAKEFDLKESAIHIANQYGRDIKKMCNYSAISFL